MAAAGIGNTGIGAAYRGYQSDGEIIFKKYSYKDGKGKETVYQKKDCLQLTLDSYEIPMGSDTYEQLKNKIFSESTSNRGFSENQLFYESYQVMKDFYDGKISQDEVKDTFKEYFYHSAGTISGEWATRALAGLYEHFSRANTRNACADNMREGTELLKGNGFSGSGTYYYNADWYWKCEEMQSLFQETANELADECGAEHVDFESVEKNTKFTLDGGITFNGVWNFMMFQHDRRSDHFVDDDMVPPKGFVYCSSEIAGSSESVNWEAIKKSLAEKNKEYAKVLFLTAVSNNRNQKKSLLYDGKNYILSDQMEQNDLYQDSMNMLQHFHINYRSNRMEFLWVAG